MAPSGNGHEHIAYLWWQNDKTNETGCSTRETMVAYVKANGDESVWSPDQNGGPSAWVHVNNNGRVEYVQTFADRRWTNNLLSLPER
jgi:Protein of unknown function (DUF3892)